MTMHANIPIAAEHLSEINELKQQVAELRNELLEIKQQEEKTYKMIENIATSQNDLETNVYKCNARLKISSKFLNIEILR